MADFAKIKRNIGRMIEQNAPEKDIDSYVQSEGVTAEMLRGDQSGQVQGQDKASFGAPIPFLPSMIMKAGQGVTFGYLDEIAGALGAEGAQNVLDRASETTGLAGDVAEAAGAIGSSIALPVGRVAQGASLTQKTIAAAKAGGVGGALYGSGNAEGGIDQRAKGAAIGGLAGAATGAIAAPVVAGVGSGIKKLARGVGIGTGSPEQVAARKVSQALDRDQVTTGQLRGDLGASRQISPDAQIADIAGENTTKLLDAAALMPGSARKGLIEGLHQRQSKQYLRLQDAIADTVGDGSKFHQTADNLITSRASRARPLYERAYNTATPYTNELQSVLERPLMQQILRRAKADALNTGDDFKQFFVEIGEDGVQIQRVPDTQALDYAKRTIDKMIGAVSRGEQTGLKAADKVSLTKLKSDLMGAIVNPDYKRALKVYAGDSALTNALDDGYAAFNKLQPEEITKAIVKLGKDEADLYRMGVARAVYEKLAQGNVGRNRVEILKQPVISNKLKAIFPNASAREKFLKAVDLEDKMFRTRAKVTGGSPTASRQTELQDAAIDPSDIADFVGIGGGVIRGDIIGSALKMMMRGKNRMSGMTPEVSDEIIRLLTSADVSAVERQAAINATRALAERSGNKRVQQLVTRALAPFSGSSVQSPIDGGTVRPQRQSLR